MEKGVNTAFPIIRLLDSVVVGQAEVDKCPIRLNEFSNRKNVFKIDEMIFRLGKKDVKIDKIYVWIE